MSIYPKFDRLYDYCLVWCLTAAASLLNLFGYWTLNIYYYYYNVCIQNVVWSKTDCLFFFVKMSIIYPWTI